MTYKIHCTNCMREWSIDDPAFDQIVHLIEESAGKMSDVLYLHNVPVLCKSHCHVYPILETLMRCCAVPEISFYKGDAGGDPVAIIVADLATLTSRVSEAETTASPTAAAALSEARRHLLRAAVAVELAQEAKAEPAAGEDTSPLKDIADAPCPGCGAHAVSFADDLSFSEMIVGVQGVVSVDIPNLTGIRCSNCGDYAFDADASAKIMQAMAEAEQGAGE